MGKILKTSAEGRKCTFPSCTHILSVYNHDTYCHLHLDQMLHKQKPKILEVIPLAAEHAAENSFTDPLAK
jgi:hypothetical protein